MRTPSRPMMLTGRWVMLVMLLIVSLAVGACSGKPAPPSPPPAQATQPPPVQATLPPTAPPAQPVASQAPAASPAAATQRPAATSQVAPTTPAKATSAPASSAGRFANPDELNSYRMKTTTWEKGSDKSKASVILTEWVKASAAKRTVIGDIETITIGDKTWIKIMGNWIQQSQPPAQPQSDDLSADIMRQMEDKFVYKEVGRETVNGIPCKKYTYSGEAVIQISERALRDEAEVRGQGEMWVADQPGLPRVAVRSRGETEIKMKAPAGSGGTGDINIAMNTEMELYDINTPITIKPPTGVLTPPVPPTIPAIGPTPTRGVGLPTAQPGLASLTPVPELKACFDSFPLPAGVKADPATAGLARMVAAGLGSPSEARGYLTNDPAVQVQQFIEKQALAAGWELGPLMQGQNVQYWAKGQFVIVLNIFPPTADRKETAIVLACGLGQGATSAATRPAATATPRSPAATATAQPPAAPPAGQTTTFDFSAALDRNWAGQNGVDAEVSLTARPGYLRFTAGSGNDLFPGTNFNAPTRYRNLTGDFTLETAVEFDPQEDYQGAGLFIWQDEGNFVRLERCFGGLGGGESGICLLKVENGIADAITSADDVPTAARRVELRLQRAGNRITAWWRDPAAGATASWQTTGSTEIRFSGGPQAVLRAGILLCVEQGAAEISADFDYLRITQ